MAFKQPRFWKTLERHPLSREYEDITGVAWENFVADVKQFGVIDRRITLEDGKVLDGWQLLRACIECDVTPVFIERPKNISAEEFVRIKNDNRRHEEAARIAARRDRVAKARAEGKSFRAIAEEQKVSVSTIVDDLNKVTVQGGVQCEPPEGKVTGKDGRQQPSTKPTPAEPKPPKAGKPRFDEKKFDKVYGPLVRLVDERANAMGKGPNYKRCHDLLGEFITAYMAWKKETA